jgi:hypothetical protein
LVLPVCISMTNGGTVPVPPLVMVAQTLYHTTKVNCNGAEVMEKMVLQTFCSTNTNRQVDDYD